MKALHRRLAARASYKFEGSDAFAAVQRCTAAAQASWLRRSYGSGLYRLCADCAAMDGASCFASAGFNASGGGEVGGAVTTAGAVGAGTIAARSADGFASAAAPSNRDASIAFDQAEHFRRRKNGPPVGARTPRAFFDVGQAGGHVDNASPLTTSPPAQQQKQKRDSIDMEKAL